MDLKSGKDGWISCRDHRRSVTEIFSGNPTQLQSVSSKVLWAKSRLLFASSKIYSAKTRLKFVSSKICRA